MREWQRRPQWEQGNWAWDLGASTPAFQLAQSWFIFERRFALNVPVAWYIRANLPVWFCEYSVSSLGRIPASAILTSMQSLKLFNGLPYDLEKLLWDSVIVHPDNMTCQSDLGFQDHGSYIGVFTRSKTTRFVMLSNVLCLLYRV